MGGGMEWVFGQKTALCPPVAPVTLLGSILAQVAARSTPCSFRCARACARACTHEYEGSSGRTPPAKKSMLQGQGERGASA